MEQKNEAKSKMPAPLPPILQTPAPVGGVLANQNDVASNAPHKGQEEELHNIFATEEVDKTVVTSQMQEAPMS